MAEIINTPRPYESTYIVRPDLDDAAYKEIREKFDGILKDQGGAIVNQEVWGLKKLAYEIERHGSGYYVYTEFTAPPSALQKLEQEYRFDERIIRFLTVTLDKHAVAFNEKRRKKKKEQKAPEPLQGEV